jgi:hypothetical protein
MPPKKTTAVSTSASSAIVASASPIVSGASPIVGAATTSIDAKGKVTHKELEEYAKKTSGFTAIARDAMDPVYNADDRLLTMSLWKAAVECAKLGGGKMVMNKHGVAARKAYKTLASALQLDDEETLNRLDQNYSEKYLRSFAAETASVTKISPNAIKEVLDPLDKVLSLAVWRLAIDLWNNKELKSTVILMDAHAQTAKAIYKHLEPLFDDDTEGNASQFDGDSAKTTDLLSNAQDDMQTDDDDADNE